MRGILKKAIIAIVLSAGVFVGFSTMSNSAEAANCSDNSVIRCGTYDIDTLRNKYNQQADVQKMYGHLGISGALLNGGAQVHEGYVTNSDKVFIGNKEVATGAITMGRQYMPGSTKHTIDGTTFYTRAPHVSFTSTKLSAFVFTDKYGQFLFAVIKSCGNPVKATATWKAPEIKVCDMTTGAIKDIKEADFDGTTQTRDLTKCEEVSACDVTTKQAVTVRKYQLGDRYTTDFEKCKTYIDVCDYTTDTIVTIEEKDFDSSNQSKDHTRCDKIQACDTQTNTIVTIAKNDLPSKQAQVVGDDSKNATVVSRYTTDLDKCKTFIDVCDKATDTVIKIEEKDFDATKHSKDKTQCDDIQVCDTTTKTVKTIAKNDMKSTDTTDLEKCKTYIDVCDKATDTVIKIEEKDFDATKHSKDKTQCEKVKVCDTTDKTIKTIAKNDVTDKMTTNLDACTPKCTVPGMENLPANDPSCKAPVEKCTVEGKTHLPKNDPACKTPVKKCTVPGMENLPATSPNCKVTVVEKCTVPGMENLAKSDAKCKTPTPVVELPKTGVADILSGTIGLSAIFAASYYYVASRRL